MAKRKVTQDNIASRLLSFRELHPKKSPLTEEEVAKALVAFKGLQYLAAEALDVDPTRVGQIIKKSPMLQELRDNLLERRLDVAEMNLSELTEEKDLGAIIWFLRTQGRKRGYVEAEKAEPPGQTEALKMSIADAKDLDAGSQVISKPDQEPQGSDSSP